MLVQLVVLKTSFRSFYINWLEKKEEVAINLVSIDIFILSLCQLLPFLQIVIYNVFV